MIVMAAADKLKDKCGDKVLETIEFRGETTVVVKKEDIVAVCAFLKEELEVVAGDPVLMMSGASGEGTVDVLRALRREIDEDRLRLKKVDEEDETWQP